MENMASSEVDVMETSMMSQSSTLSVPASMSMRGKSQLKRRINKEHNSNFRAGYVPVNEAYLHKAGIRGRKRFLLYSCLVVLLVLAVLNTALTAWLMWIYHITHKGLEPMEFTHSSAGYLLRFLDVARFDSLTLNGACLGSRSNRNLVFTGINSKFILSTSDVKNESMVEIRKDLVQFSVDDLKLVSPSGKQYFSLSNLKVPGLINLKNLHADVVETRQIKTAPNYDDLSIESWDQIKVTGFLGVKASSSKEMDIQAHHLYVNSTNGTTILDGHVGIYISQMIPRVLTTSPIDPNIINAKLCVCGQSGRVFVVPVSKAGMGCATANEMRNPCLE